MTTSWLCATCGVEQTDAADPPERCAICTDERQYVLPSGQRWTTMPELIETGREVEVVELEPGLHGIRITPRVGIGHQAVLVQTPEGNLLWDPPGYLDEQLAEAITELGGVSVIAASHPHMFGAQVHWSRRFGGAPILVNARDAEWVQRPDPAIRTWNDLVEPVAGVTLHRVGGHFPGSAVAALTGADGRTIGLVGDALQGTPDQHWVTFLWSYPNRVPMSAAVVRVVADRVSSLGVDRVYDNFDGRVLADAGAWIQRSAERYIGWVSGDFDHLTGTSD